MRYTLKTPYRDGTTQVFFEPVDFMARLAALVPKPSVNLTRFHGVFAPNSRLKSTSDAGEAWQASTPSAANGSRAASGDDLSPAS